MATQADLQVAHAGALPGNIASEYVRFIHTAGAFTGLREQAIIGAIDRCKVEITASNQIVENDIQAENVFVNEVVGD